MFGGHEARAGTSRFLSQATFLVYKLTMALFFMSLAIYWREAAGESIVLAKLTHQTWYITMAYFFVSTASAYLILRAIGKRAATASSGAALEEGEGPRASEMADVGVEVAAAAPTSGESETVKGTESPVPLALRRLQLVTWNIACNVSLLVVGLFWYADYDRDRPVTSVDVLAHGAIAPIMLIDQFLVADHFRLRHIIFSQVYGVIYIIFNIIWYYTGWKERMLYEVLDWDNKPLVACIYAIVSILFLAPLFSLIHLFICSRRERLHSRLQEKLEASRRIITLG